MEGFVGFCKYMYEDPDKEDVYNVEKTCSALYCTKADEECSAQGARALPGSLCAKGKTCNWDGQCVPDPTAVTPTGPGFSIFQDKSADGSTALVLHTSLYF